MATQRVQRPLLAFGISLSVFFTVLHTASLQGAFTLASSGYNQRRSRLRLRPAAAKRTDIEDEDDDDISLNIDDVANAEKRDNQELAMQMATDQDVAMSIAESAVALANENNPEVELELAKARRKQEIDAATVIPSGPVFDYVSLLDKYGGAQKVWDDHDYANQEGYFNQLDALGSDLDMIKEHNRTASKSYVEFEHASGSKLVLVGTNHLSLDSTEFTRQTVRDVRPECVVLERRMGDDSLQRLSLPEKELQDLLMEKPPGVFLSSDSPIDRARKFQLDKMWLEATGGWRDIGGEAANGHEFAAALEEFALQRASGESLGPRGGTVCLADSDLRPVWTREEGGMPPNQAELGVGPCLPLRDLSLSQAMRAALNTHASVVGVVGKNHLAGISRLLAQDPKIRVVSEGVPLWDCRWVPQLEDNGKQWEREALVSTMFMKLAQAIDYSPMGSFIAAEAVVEMQRMREATAADLKKQGLEAQPAAPVSSQMGADFVERDLLITPKSEYELRRWLDGERLPGQDAGDFPFENRKLRKKAPIVPGTGFPDPPDEEYGKKKKTKLLSS